MLTVMSTIADDKNDHRQTNTSQTNKGVAEVGFMKVFKFCGKSLHQYGEGGNLLLCTSNQSPNHFLDRHLLQVVYLFLFLKEFKAQKPEKGL